MHCRWAPKELANYALDPVLVHVTLPREGGRAGAAFPGIFDATPIMSAQACRRASLLHQIGKGRLYVLLANLKTKAKGTRKTEHARRIIPYCGQICIFLVRWALKPRGMPSMQPGEQ